MSAATEAKKQEQAREQYRKDTSIVPPLKLKPAPIETTRARAHSPATANIPGLGGNSDESKAVEKSAEHRSGVRASRRKEMEKLIDSDWKGHGSVYSIKLRHATKGRSFELSARRVSS